MQLTREEREDKTCRQRVKYRPQIVISIRRAVLNGRIGIQR